jgi:hypothetical protein
MRNAELLFASALRGFASLFILKKRQTGENVWSAAELQEV